jgi:hypothetical protein
MLYKITYPEDPLKYMIKFKAKKAYEPTTIMTTTPNPTGLTNVIMEIYS